MTNIVILSIILGILFILKTIFNYLVFKYEEIPFYRYKIKWLKLEYKKNKGKLLKFLTNIQLEYDIYEYHIDCKCKPIGKLGEQITYYHIPDKHSCRCGYKICPEKYRLLKKKLINKLDLN